eukprot:TRINITY_DN21358_c0_g1_i1.p2 TRINITY_DN21358_c0_g1~~TRINITY_DN21358_c0_g1_i1.p2  ORF type:complete len:321 (+),score=84.86 TRINITY_DN21358_c0_g1_i1:35-964(+)
MPSPAPPRGAGEPLFHTAAHGAKLCYEVFRPEAAVAPLPLRLVYLHGVHESADTMTVRNLAAEFRDATVYALEHHAHGRSYGTRGVVASFDELVADAYDFIEGVVVRELAGQEAFAIIGHSMGGAVATYLCHRIATDPRCTFAAKLRGGILLAPALTGGIPNVVVRGALRCIASAFPSAGLGPPEDPSQYDTGSGRVLNFSGKMPARTCVMFVDLFMKHQAALDAGLNGTPPFTFAAFPALVLHGERDLAVPLQGNAPIYAYTPPQGSHTPQVEVLKGETHSILTSKHTARYLVIMRAWLQGRPAPAGV